MGPGDPENPQNWPLGKKWAATMVVSGFTFMSPVSSSMVAPALSRLGEELGMSTKVEVQLALSIFVLAYAIGPMFLGPLSEVYGRARVLQLSNLFYLVWNLGCGFAHNKAEMFAFRFLSGIGGSAPLAVGAGVLSDCWSPEQRGKAIAIYTLAPLLGPIAGPIAGGFIAQTTTWRWVFWATSIAAAAIQLLGLFFLQETYPPILLQRRTARLGLAASTGTEADNARPGPGILDLLSTALVRPFRLLTTQPIVQLIALYTAYLFGMLYLLLSTFPGVWEGVYGESPGIGGLNYIALGAGYMVGSQVGARLNDRIYKRLKLRHSSNNPGQPEFRIPLMFAGSGLVPFGIFLYGWSVHARLLWLVPDLGFFVFAVGSVVCMQCMQTYVIDSYTRFAASGLAATVTLRSLAGFGFPLFAPYMYETLEYGWGNSVLGFLSVAVGLPAPFVFWGFGQRLRAVSRFAAG